MSDLFDENEFVFHKKGDTIQSAGFSINSNFLKNDKTLINQTGGNSNGLNVSDLFKNLSVPSGLFYSNKTGGSKKTTEIITDEVISNDIHDNLLKMVELSGSATKKTRRSLPQNTNKKTKSNKK